MKHKKKSFKGFSSIVFYTENDVEIEFKAEDLVYITPYVNAEKEGKRSYATNDRFMVILRAESNGKIAGYEDCDDTKFSRIKELDDIECIAFKYSNKKDKMLCIPYLNDGGPINQSQDSLIMPNGNLVVLFTGYEEENHLNDDQIMKIVKEVLDNE